jgi:hypothetical protein
MASSTASTAAANRAEMWSLLTMASGVVNGSPLRA